MVKAMEKSKNYMDEYELLSEEELNTLKQTSSLVAKFQNEALTEREHRRSAELQTQEKLQLEKIKKNRFATNMDRVKQRLPVDRNNKSQKTKLLDQENNKRAIKRTVGTTPIDDGSQSSDGPSPTSSTDSKEKQDSIKESTEGELSVDSDSSLMEDLKRILMEGESSSEPEEDVTDDVTNQHYSPSDMIKLFTVKPYIPSTKAKRAGPKGAEGGASTFLVKKGVHKKAADEDGYTFKKTFKTAGKDLIDVDVNGYSVNVEVTIPRLSLDDDTITESYEDRKNRNGLPKYGVARNYGMGTKGSQKREAASNTMSDECDKYGRHAPKVVSPLVLNSRSSSDEFDRDYLKMQDAFRKGKNPVPGLCGLENLGNSCFMNAGLQCLFVIKPFYRFFLEGGHMNVLETKSKDQQFQNSSLCVLLGRLIEKVFSGCYLTCEPSALFTSLQTQFVQIDGFIQHDCQEFLALFLDALHQELNTANVAHRRRIRQVDMSHAKTADHWWRLYNEEHESVIVDTFQGQFRNKIRCSDCGHVSLTYQLFSFLSLPLVSQKLQTFVVTFIRNNDFEHALNSGKPRALRSKIAPYLNTSHATIAELDHIVSTLARNIAPCVCTFELDHIVSTLARNVAPCVCTFELDHIVSTLARIVAPCVCTFELDHIVSTLARIVAPCVCTFELDHIVSTLARNVAPCVCTFELDHIVSTLARIVAPCVCTFELDHIVSTLARNVAPCVCTFELDHIVSTLARIVAPCVCTFELDHIVSTLARIVAPCVCTFELDHIVSTLARNVAPCVCTFELDHIVSTLARNVAPCVCTFELDHIVSTLARNVQPCVCTFELDHIVSTLARIVAPVRVQASKPSTTTQIKQKLVSSFPVDQHNQTLTISSWLLCAMVPLLDS
ncbi:hypothetical protein QZH41_010736 [Actinostola sp. cb2023]|nr:hypothetical protein QZH41_010736 [Actinostola sp. cb2023]